MILNANGLETTGFVEKAEFINLCRENEGWLQTGLA